MPPAAAFFRRALFFLLLWIAAVANANERLILVFGDSLSSGYHLNVEDSWPALLNKRLQETGHDLRIVNASRKGETTAGGRNRLAAALDEYRPTFVILELGANDGLRRQSLGTMQENLNEMLRMILAKGSTPILVGMKLPPDFDPAYRDQFSAVFARTAEETRTPFVPFLLEEVVENPNLFLADRLHPNAAGQPKLLDVVWPVLSKAIEQQ
ncbi:arylesterase [Herbaspirillum sp. HC18]|nr:arylesterase [Herbaspirillum sp. HC18]